MKKVFVAVAIVATIGTAFASNSLGYVAAKQYTDITTGNDTIANDTVISITTVETVAVEENVLPEQISKSIADNYPEATVKSFQTEEKEGSKLYTIIISDKEGSESTILVKENGELVK